MKKQKLLTSLLSLGIVSMATPIVATSCSSAPEIDGFLDGAEWDYRPTIGIKSTADVSSINSDDADYEIEFQKGVFSVENNGTASELGLDSSSFNDKLIIINPTASSNNGFKLKLRITLNEDIDVEKAGKQFNITIRVPVVNPETNPIINVKTVDGVEGTSFFETFPQEAGTIVLESQTIDETKELLEVTTNPSTLPSDMTINLYRHNGKIVTTESEDLIAYVDGKIVAYAGFTYYVQGFCFLIQVMRKSMVVSRYQLTFSDVGYSAAVAKNTSPESEWGGVIDDEQWIIEPGDIGEKLQPAVYFNIFSVPEKATVICAKDEDGTQPITEGIDKLSWYCYYDEYTNWEGKLTAITGFASGTLQLYIIIKVKNDIVAVFPFKIIKKA